MPRPITVLVCDVCSESWPRHVEAAGDRLGYYHDPEDASREIVDVIDCVTVLMNKNQGPPGPPGPTGPMGIPGLPAASGVPSEPSPKVNNGWSINPHCLETWPEAGSAEYHASCCRFPKSCSAWSYDPAKDETDTLVNATHDVCRRCEHPVYYRDGGWHHVANGTPAAYPKNEHRFTD